MSDFLRVSGIYINFVAWNRRGASPRAPHEGAKKDSTNHSYEWRRISTSYSAGFVPNSRR